MTYANLDDPTPIVLDLARDTLRVNELYERTTVQGEGPHVGRLCTFVRLYGCNLHCRWCDTPYTWDTTGRNGTAYPREGNVRELTVDHVARHVVALDVPVCVVSGGEPMLQSRAVLNLAAKLLEHKVDVHVETNGTRPPPNCSDGSVDPIAHYSVSPKLPSAEAGKNALLLDQLAMWAGHPRAIFKVVCANRDEVRQAAGLFDLLHVRQDARWIMPEGRTSTEVDNSLAAVVESVLMYGMNLTPRLHVQLWGNERGR